MTPFWIHTWCILAAALSASSCALLGTYLVLRKMSLLGDAISHAILPGLALAFLLSGSRSSLPMFLGASFFGLLTAFLSQFLSKNCRVDEGAALGVVFTTLFAVGVLLIRIAADKIDLDPGCVLYGLLEFIPFDTIHVFGHDIPRSILSLAPTFLIILLLIKVFYKELQIVSFDPVLASALGFNAAAIHFGLMTAVAATSVAAFEAVGSILVVAMFIIPAATARLFTDSLRTTLRLSLLFGILSALLGYYFAVLTNTSVAGMMSVIAGILFLLSATFSPRYGLIRKISHHYLLTIRVVSEDILGLIYRCQEAHFNRAFPLSASNISEALGGGVIPRLALLRLKRTKRLRRNEMGLYELEESGKHEARQLVRRHRLWENYLVQQLHLPPDHVHGTAMTLEHVTNEAMEGALVEKTGSLAKDPHGKEIP